MLLVIVLINNQNLDLARLQYSRRCLDWRCMLQVHLVIDVVSVLTIVIMIILLSAFWLVVLGVHGIIEWS